MIDDIGLQSYLGIVLIISALGYAQGHITGSAIRKKFKIGRNFVKFLAIPIATLFFLHAFIKINGMIDAGNSQLTQTFTNLNLTQLPNLILGILPTDIFEVISFALPIGLFLLTFVAEIRGISKNFIRVMSVIAMIFMLSINYLGIVVDDDVMTLFILYQLTIPVGILISTGAFKSIQRWSARINFPNI